MGVSSDHIWGAEGCYEEIIVAPDDEFLVWCSLLCTIVSYPKTKVFNSLFFFAVIMRLPTHCTKLVIIYFCTIPQRMKV